MLNPALGKPPTGLRAIISHAVHSAAERKIGKFAPRKNYKVDFTNRRKDGPYRHRNGVMQPHLTMHMPYYDLGGSRCSWPGIRAYIHRLSSSHTNGRRGSDTPSKLYSPTLGQRRALHEPSALGRSVLRVLLPGQLPHLSPAQLRRALPYSTS
jgi:hypothetical protein